MTTSLQERYEITAVPGVDTDLNRLVVVPDIGSFWPKSSFDGRNNIRWTTGAIQDVMRWCSFDPVNNDNAFAQPRLAVASPWITAPQYRTKGYKHAWSQWCRQHSIATIPMNLYLMNETGGPGPTNEFGCRDGFATCAKLYPREFFNRLDLEKFWLPFFAEAAPTLSWEGHDTHYGTNLIERFTCGVFSKANASKGSGGGIIEEVVLITGHAGDHEVRAFHIPTLEELV